MSENKINYKFFQNDKDNKIDPKIIFSNYLETNLTLIKDIKSYCYQYNGFRIIRCQNTNKAIRNLLTNNIIETNIKLNDKFVKNKDVIIISPFTKISDILSSRSNGNLHNYLKESKLFQKNKEIEELIINCLNDLGESIINLIDYDLSKCDLINYIDIKDEFISQDNIKDILNVIKSYNNKPLIIFNDIDYLKYEEIINYLEFFNFLYFINGFDDSYVNIENYNDYLIDYDYITSSIN